MSEIPSYAEQRMDAATEKYIELKSLLPPFAIAWLNSKPNLQPSSKLAYAKDLLFFFQYVCDTVLAREGFDKEPSELTLADVSDPFPSPNPRFDDFFFNAYAEHITISRRPKKGQDEHFNSLNSVERMLVPLRGMYHYFSERGDIPRNPLATFAKRKEKKPKTKAKTHLDNGEVAKMLAAAETADGIELTERQKKFRDRTRLRDLAIILVFLKTGIRISELVGINLGDVSFEKRSITITRKGGTLDLVYFPDDVADALSDYIVAERGLIKIKTAEEPLFLSLHGKRISTDQVDNIVKRYASGIKDKKVSAHRLRATYGTALYLASHDIALTKDALGHSSAETTMKYYVDAHDENMKRAALFRDMYDGGAE